MGASDLDVAVEGEGRPLVLVHSLLSDRTAYEPFVRLIAGRRKVVLLNLPGFGASPPDGASTLRDHATALARVFDDMSLPPETDIMGNGLGGFVALTFAADHGDRFRRLLLVGSALAFPEAGRATFRGLADKVDSDGIAAVAGPAIRRMFPDDFIAANPEIVADRTRVLATIDPNVFAAACRALAALDLAPLLPRIRNRTLVATGEHDGATPPALGRALAARLPHGEFMELVGLGHAPHLQAPDEFLAAVSGFLRL
jgi:3-oxoadipate enol-lactonase